MTLPVDDQPLREEAVRAIEEGRADHAAGRTFTLPEIREDLKRLSKADLHRLRDRLSGRTDDDRQREHAAFVGALEDFVERTSADRRRDGEG